MPVFTLDTRGAVAEPECKTPPMLTVGRPLVWHDLDSFAQGYVEALFFTDTEHGAFKSDGSEIGSETDARQWNPETDSSLPDGLAFSDLAGRALAQIIADCARFQDSAAWKALESLDDSDRRGMPDDEQAGRDFWYTRNGHSCGFWDGDWPEPHGAAFTEAARVFGEVDSYLGDDGKVYL